MKKIEIKNVKGSNDYGGDNQIIRNYISDSLRNIFEKYGYTPLDTSILCYYDLLTLKYDDDNDIVNEIYKVKDQGQRNLALRYDLTVPFTKYIALNKEIKLPYKRYEIGKVFRDGPIKKGRTREFIQCDVDCVGIKGQMIEAECVQIFVEGFKKLGIDVIIKYNNRKIMTGIIEICNVLSNKISETITIIDKFEKLNKEEIKNEFIKIGLNDIQIQNLVKYLNLDFDAIVKQFGNTQNINLKDGIDEIRKFNFYIKNLELEKYVKFVATLARGQEYYTGIVFEVYEKQGKINSSIGGGGRYDKIISDFISDGKEYPAIGISFGLDVIFEILKENNELKKNITDVYIVPMNNEILAIKIANELREKNIKVDIDMCNKKLKKSLSYADENNIPYLIILGEEELKEKKVILKQMKLKMQKQVYIKNITESIINDIEKEGV